MTKEFPFNTKDIEHLIFKWGVGDKVWGNKKIFQMPNI
jgi:hypothetical protein